MCSTTTSSTRVKKGRKARIALIAVLAVVVIAAVSFFVYVGVYYHADEAAIEATEDRGVYASDEITVEQGEGYLAFVPSNPRDGFIFYPGGKVQAEVYAPLMQALAERGILCVLCPMPFNLAVFDVNAADGIREKFPLARGEWYIGGHSLGGSMAAQYAADHLQSADGGARFAGIVLLGSYSTADLSQADSLRALVIRGSDDQVLNADAYESNRKNLPPDSEEIVIAGGNHGQFGSYGHQDGDGEATITPEEQWRQTADAIAKWMEE